MKLYSLLFGSSSPVGADNVVVPVQDLSGTSLNSNQMASTNEPEITTVPDNVTPEASIPPVSSGYSPPISLNLDKLRKIFQALSSINENKTPDVEVGEEPLRMRRKYLGIFERFEKRFGSKANRKSKRKSNRLSRDRVLTLLSRRNSGTEESKSMKTWARNNLNRLTTSMRHVRSDSFIARKIIRKQPAAVVDDTVIEEPRLILPTTMKTKRSTIPRSRALIRNASETAHQDLVKHLEKNSSQHCVEAIDFRDYTYPFENLVFEGGGVKVHTYIGAIKCLEEAGIKPKRLAGTSAGAITAGLLAVGYTSEEIHILYEYDVEYNVKDGTCGLLSLLPNMFRHYGWNPGERAMRWFGECLAVKTGNPDITFQEIYDQYGVELCIVAVNLSSRSEEYFHPKTTPDMPIKLAARMSSSLPGYFQPVRQGSSVYVDGGVLCNFPLHVFDGWWLSMNPEDVFYRRMGSVENLTQMMDRKNRFGTYNDKTLGFCMYSMFDDKALRFEIEKRHKLKVMKRPKTKLADKRRKFVKERDLREVTRDSRLEALFKFFKVLRQVHMADEHGELKKEALITEFQHQLDMSSDIEEDPQQQIFSKVHFDTIFDADADITTLLEDIHANENGVVSNSELIAFLKRHHVDVQNILGSQYMGHPEVSNFGSFFMTIQESLMNSARRVYIQPEDLDRTVGINTDYIKMDDFNLEREDQEFLIQQGYMSTAAFLRYWIHHNVKVKDVLEESCSHESDLSASGDSDISPTPVFTCHSADDIDADIDDEAGMTTSTSSSRSTKSPTKSTGSQTSHADMLAESPHFETVSEEVIVTEIEHCPLSVSNSSLPQISSMCLDSSLNAHSHPNNNTLELSSTSKSTQASEDNSDDH